MVGIGLPERNPLETAPPTPLHAEYTPVFSSALDSSIIGRFVIR